MLSTEEQRRYNRQIILPEIGISGQEKLRNSRVLVLGCGGLGSPVLLYLTAAGIGTLGLVEHDSVEESNLQRQILYDTSAVNSPKIEEAEARLKAMNPSLNIEKWATRFNANNALEILQGYDLLIDTSDNFPTRYLANDACVLLNKPLVYGAIHRFEGQVGVFNYQGSTHYRDLFPTPPPPEQAPNCSEAGVLGVLAGIIGAMQANEALKIILGIGEVLAGKILVLDSLTMQNRIINIPKNPSNAPITELIDYQAFCGLHQTLTWEDIRTWEQQNVDFQLIDVREYSEYEAQNWGGTPIPLSQFEQFVPLLDRTKRLVIHCQTGKRSQQAIEILKKNNFDQVFNLDIRV